MKKDIKIGGNSCSMFIDERPPLLGWATGYYLNLRGCHNCGKSYTGHKRSYHCADCVYTYTEQLEYEKAWHFFYIEENSKAMVKFFDQFRDKLK